MFTAIAGATAGDVSRIMIYGPSGIMAACSKDFKPKYNGQKKELIWPNGAVTYILYGSDREAARGNNIQFVWCDEIHKWQYPEEAFENILMCLRYKLRNVPMLCLITSTPKPTKFTRDIENRKDKHGRNCTITTVGSTYDNLTNLSESFMSVIAKYEGTRLGEQELNAQIMDDNPAAMFKREWIARDRVIKLPDSRMIKQIGVGVDPAASHKKNSNHTGIITGFEGKAPTPDMLQIMGEVRNPDLNHFYIRLDSSVVGTPWEWGSAVQQAVDKNGAGVTVIEDNQGGDMCESTLVNAGVRNRIERVHAAKDKAMRASPVSLIMQQGRIHFYRDLTVYNDKDGDNLDVLEDELCNWIPGDDSPDRMDAMVHLINYFEPNVDKDIDKRKVQDFLKFVR